jgi:phosphotransferase system  glucose/maltose/N-acetylglucosamine-specific IIC component
MSIDDQSIIGGIVVGAVGGWLAARVISAIVFGAVKRAESGFGAVGFIVSLAALALAGLSILLPPVSLVALAALAWLAIARSRRAQRKHEGLRILR